MSIINALSVVLILIGAVNWGLVGLLNFNLVEFLFKKNSLISRLIYTLVGIAGVYTILYLIF
ncbi:DUF378 domain-containing protein [Clostridium sp. D2Q-11]|uniref:DUF378 domain-containing protein n=1 Tax=Anaeromonas frigoriresistens TaxID=2683708 RepID=A0A942V437_9FIRM|nr:DUF378 domain-containing protein [Anaeromonas frigoriresistens]MBS4539552.1 DUF378 domain-containing protein [Anaeromonas frigoriresistens]